MPLSDTPQNENQGKSSRVLLGAFAVLGMALFCLFMALGIWQIERLQWKQGLIERVDQRVHAAPTAPPQRDDWSNISRERDEYKRVSLSGSFLNDKELLVHALTERGAGYWVMTPMRSDGGEIIYINRGFVPGDKATPSSRPQSQIEGKTTITGLMRMPEPDGFFLRPNDPARNDWNSRDVMAFAQIQQLGEVAPYFIDAEASTGVGSLPIGGLTVISFRNHHLSYAITWFFLAAMVAGAAIFVWRYEVRKTS